MTRRPARLPAALTGLALILTACGADPEPTAGAVTPATPATPTSAPPAAAPPSAPSAGHELGTVTTGDDVREHRLMVPPNAQSPMALAVVLHDAGGTAESIGQATQFDRAALAGGFAVVYAGSRAGTWNGGFCCGDAPHEGIDDVGYLDALLDLLSADDRLDSDRVHLVGVSNGAVMAYRYACERADRVAGVGSVAGAMIIDDCTPGRPVRVIEIHGTADPVVPFDGGELPEFTRATAPAPPSHDLAAAWAAFDGCPEPPRTATAGPVTTTTWQGCADGTAVRLVAIEGAGHTWYAPEFGAVDGAVDATDEIVRFLGLAAP